MIAGVTKFSGGSRDARALAAHLGKPQVGGAQFVALNTAAGSVRGAIAEARAMAEAAGIGERPFLHVHLSPSTSLDRDQLIRAAEVLCRELGVTDQPVGIELHGKPRASGQGEMHAHLVIGRAGASGRVLASGYEKIKVETATRVAEFEVGEPHVLGRHFKSSIRHLESIGRHDVAASMRAAHGNEPEKPRGLSADKRQQLERGGVDAVVQREAVRAAWSRSDDGRSLARALAESGLELRQGDKPGVWVVAAGDATIGSVDRLVGEKRRAVAARLRDYHPARSPDGRADPAHDEQGRQPGGGGEEDPRRDRGQPSGLGRDGGVGPAESRPRASGDGRDDAGQPVAEVRSDGGRDRADRDASPDERLGPGQRRNAVAALTVAVASQAAAQLARLRRIAMAIAGHDRARLVSADERLEARRRPVEPAPDPVPEPSSERFRGRLARQLAERKAAEPTPPPPKPLTTSEILAQQRAGTWVDPDAPSGPPTSGYRPPRP